MELDLTGLRNAVTRLEEALADYHLDPVPGVPRYKRNMRAAVIQSFEFTYELSFKTLRRYLRLASANPAEIGQLSFSNVIREAYRQELIRLELSAWREFRENRAITGRTYDEEKAQAVFEVVPGFLDEARYLLSQLGEKIETLD